MAYFRQPVPTRVFYGKGTGAFGYFEVTNDVTEYTRASVFNQVGKRTEALVRFSRANGDRGSPDTVIDTRGMSTKLYTDTGNYDIIGTNIPVFPIKDPLYFTELATANYRCPVTSLIDPTTSFEFYNRHIESWSSVMHLYSSFGLPRSYRYASYHAHHTFKWVNANNQVFWVKMHWVTEQGLEFLTRERADFLAANEPDYFIRDLYAAIDQGVFPSWVLNVQIMPEADASTFEFDITDASYLWDENQYPLVEVGRLVLNRIPQDHLQEVEMASFAPGNMIDGIEPSNDPMLLGRMFSYEDASKNRLGRVRDWLPSNRPYGLTLSNPSNEAPPYPEMVCSCSC